jgi:hypothetical protein
MLLLEISRKKIKRDGRTQINERNGFIIMYN